MAVVLLELLSIHVPPVCTAAVSRQYGCVTCCRHSQALFVGASGVMPRRVGQQLVPAHQLQLGKGVDVAWVRGVLPFRLWSGCTVCTAFTGCAPGMQAVGVLHPVYDIHRIAERPGQHLEVSSLLLDMVTLPDQRAQVMEEMIKTFVFAIPKVRLCPLLRLQSEYPG